MQNAKLLRYLRCPEDRSELKFATEELILREINAAIRAGRLANRRAAECFTNPSMPA